MQPRVGPVLRVSIQTFHSQLPSCAPTPLHSVPDLARSLNVGHVFVKDETSRFGLPSFKILGASWAIPRALAVKAALPLTTTLNEAGKAARAKGVDPMTYSEENWGRAMARVGKILGAPVTVLVSKNMDDSTKEKIASEGAKIMVNPGN